MLCSLCVCVCALPSVTQDGGVVQGSSPVAVHLVDLGSVLQEELAGCQGILSQIGPGHTLSSHLLFIDLI